MSTDEYMEYVFAITSSKELTDEQKTRCLEMLKIIRKYSYKELEELENSAYKNLKDIEKVSHELNLLYAYKNQLQNDYKKNDLDQSLKVISYRLAKGKKQKSIIQKLKEDITKYQIDNDIYPYFFTTYEEILKRIKENKYLNTDDILFRKKNNK